MPSTKHGQRDSKSNNKGSTRNSKQNGGKKLRKPALEINTVAFGNTDSESRVKFQFKRDASTSSHQTSASSDYDKQTVQKIMKSKSKGKQKKLTKQCKRKKISKQLIDNGNCKEKGEEISQQTECETSDHLSDSFNETLRWDNICSDSDEEIERLRIYKENRRKRYIEAVQVKILQKISHQ